MTVQVVLALEARLAAAHCRAESVAGASRERVADVEEPFSVAVRVAVWSAVKADAAARNVPLTEPEGIVTEAGTVRLAELELRPMAPPPDPGRVTVHVLELPGTKVPGLHAMELIAVATPTVPPVPVTAMASPVGETP
jgi:hypothetical protein